MSIDRRIPALVVVVTLGLAIYGLTRDGCAVPVAGAGATRPAETIVGADSADDAGPSFRRPEPPHAPTRVAVPAAETFQLFGVVLRNERPVAGRVVSCRHESGKGLQSATTGLDGAFRFEVPAGTFVLDVAFDEGLRREVQYASIYPVDELTMTRPARRSIAVSDRDVRCDLVLPTGALIVRVFDAVTFLQLADASVAWLPSQPMLETLHLVADASAVARFDDVAPGSHRLVASLRGYTAGLIEVDVADAPVAVDLRLAPTGALDVLCVDRDARPLDCPAAKIVVVRNVRTGTVVDPSPVDPLRASRTLEFDDLTPGAYTVSVAADTVLRHGTRAIRFRPAQSDTVCEVDVIAGRIARATLPIRERSWVVLDGRDARGENGLGTLDLEWLDPENGVTLVLPAGSSAQRGPHFVGYLAPGTYSLVFTYGERISRESLTVDGAPIERSFALPW